MKESKDILAVSLLSAAKQLLKYWYILGISVVIMLAFTWLNLKYTSKTYSVGASIVIRIDNKNNFARNTNNDIMRAFDFVMQDRSFQNELFYLRSLPLIQEVVREMDVRVSYFTQNDIIPIRFDFGKQNIYKSSPILVIPEPGNTQAANLLFHVDIIDESRFRLFAKGENVDILDLQTERFVSRVSNIEINSMHRFGEVVNNQYGSFRILLNPGFETPQMEGKNLFFQFNNLNQVAGRLQRGLTVSAQGLESTMAHLEFRTDNARLGTDFLSRLIDSYILNNLNEANLLANKTIEHIERQLEDVSGDLNLSERQLQNLRVNRNVMDIEDKSRDIYQQLRALELRRDEVSRRLSHFRQMDDYFKQYKDSTKILAPSALGLNDGVLNNLITDLTELNSEKQRIISQDQTRSPRLATLNIRIDNLKDVITENISFSLNTIQNELTDLDQRISALNREFAILPGTQREMLDIERRFKLNDATYTSLLERRIQAQIMKAAKLPDAKIIEPPIFNGVTSPRPSISYMIALVLGLALPSGLIMAKQLIKNQLETKEDVALITSSPEIGSIPYVGSSEDKMVLNNPRSAMAEAFYILRSNLVYYLHGEKNKVILITSSIPDEGKSFSAFNLATSFAFSNSKTILIEFDLRKPSQLMSGYNDETLPGVSSYLIKKAELNEIIIKTDAPNLDVIPAGQIPPNPIELLSGNRTKELIDELKQIYDYVIIDTPPYGLLTDSFMLMHHTDINLFVTRLGHTKKSVLANSIGDLERKKVENLYLLINGEHNDMITYGYGRYPYLDDSKKNILGFKRKKRRA